MKNFFVSLYNYISYWGVKESYSYSKRDYTILLNRYVFALSVVFLFQALFCLYFFGFTRDSIALIVFFCCITLVNFNIKKKRETRLVSSVVILILIIIITYYSSFCGVDSGTFLYYFPVLSALPVFLNFKEDKYYFSFFTILTLICLYISLSGFQIVEKFNFSNGYEQKLLIINLIFTVLFLSINFFFLEEKRNTYYNALYSNLHKKKKIMNLENELSRLKELLKENVITEDYLQELVEAAQLNDTIFIEKFEKFFPGFFDKVKKISVTYLNLSDLKYCGLLKLGFSSKQIAIYTNSSVKSVEGKKYRLRKKLDIPTDEVSTTWFSNL